MSNIQSEVIIAAHKEVFYIVVVELLAESPTPLPRLLVHLVLRL